MKSSGLPEAVEKLIRLRAPRRDAVVDLLVHYEKRRSGSCLVYKIITIERV